MFVGKTINNLYNDMKETKAENRKLDYDIESSSLDRINLQSPWTLDAFASIIPSNALPSLQNFP